MKTNTFTKVRVDERLLNEIHEVKETIADLELTPKKKTTFCAADLWNIQRNKRNRVQRRYF